MHRWLAWNVFFPIQERLKGHPTLKILEEMERIDRLPVPELERLQRERLRDLISYCSAHVPYVRETMKSAGLAPEDIRDVGDLAHLPLMSKGDFRVARERLRSEVARNLAPFSTGGSTGEPLIFDIGKRRVASRVACRQRVSRWWGVSVGDRELALWGSPLELTRQDWVRGIRDRLLATHVLSAYELNERKMSQFLDFLERGRFRHIFTYPTSMYLLCQHAQKEGRDLRKLGIQVVFVTSEVLFPHQRDTIVETFGCPVANGYGGRDSGFIAHECPQGGMHLMADAVVTEIVGPDGKPAPMGESGEIVVTDLYSHEAPFIRYRTGDIGALSNRRCSCGRPLPLLERLDGRANDSIVTPDGRVMHGQSVVSLMMNVEGIEQFRVHQIRADCFRISIVRNGRFRPESEDRIRKQWADRLRARVELTIEYVPSFPMERSGKFRYIVSDLEQGRLNHEAGREERAYAGNQSA